MQYEEISLLDKGEFNNSSKDLLNVSVSIGNIYNEAKNTNSDENSQEEIKIPIDDRSNYYLSKGEKSSDEIFRVPSNDRSYSN